MPEPQQILPRSTPIIDVVFASTKPQYSLLGFFLCKTRLCKTRSVCRDSVSSGSVKMPAFY
ncbi:MAG TPA: hypothetical protein DEF80_05255 [Pantoea sp.]|nr:hypothetical protein [Pantoea sp.]